MKLLLRWAFSAMALMLLPQFIDAIRVDSFYAALAAALCIGLVNALIRPILIIITLPINILTLGLLTFVINGLLFWFVASFIEGFTVVGFWPAVFGAILYSLATWAINVVLRDPATK
jgi:putative membrane protein